jgi:hypothetical protein
MRNRAIWETLVRDEFERCHPDDTFEDLRRRAAFSKEDRGLLRDWMAIANARAAAQRAKLSPMEPRHRGRRARSNSAPPRNMARASRVR